MNSPLIFLFSFAFQKPSRSADPTAVQYSAVTITFGRTLVPKRYCLVMNHDEREKYEH